MSRSGAGAKTGPERTSDRRELAEVYDGYKLLALSYGAGIILREPSPGLGEQAARLHQRCAAALRDCTDTSVRPALAACLAASEELARALAERPFADESLAGRLRERHRQLRREVWHVLPFEYVSCASHEHDHPEAEVSPDDDRAHVPDHDNPQHGGR